MRIAALFALVVGCTLCFTGCSKPSEEQCKQFTAKMKELTLAEIEPLGEEAVSKADAAFEKDGRERLMKTCADLGSARDIECVMALKTLAEINECS